MIEEQLSMVRLLGDPIYRAWIQKEPTLNPVPPCEKPWRVWAQREFDSHWSRREFKTWEKALLFTLRLVLELDFHDAALNSRVQGFKPPVVMDKRLGKRRYHIPAFPGQSPLHEWCPHCRRPTIFTAFAQHHTFNSFPFRTEERRCAVCGIALSAIKIYR